MALRRYIRRSLKYKMDNVHLRKEIISTAMQMSDAGLGVGMSGNISVRVDGGFLITPSGMKYNDLLPEDIVFVDFEGKASGTRKPSSEWRFHKDIYKSIDQANAIVHAHPPYSTALACLGKEIPAFHYMVAVAGGDNIRCAEYHLFGTQELSDAATKALKGRRACLLANHGLIAHGKTLEKAFSLALEVESIAQQYQLALQIGTPTILSDEQMQEVIERFKSYGENAQK